MRNGLDINYRNAGMGDGRLSAVFSFYERRPVSRAVSYNVARDLPSPIDSVALRRAQIQLATMPEATINKYREAFAAE